MTTLKSKRALLGMLWVKFKVLVLVANPSLKLAIPTPLSLMREADYEIGHFIRERLIPRAVLYYTGELNDDEDDEEDDEDYEEDMDEDDEEGEEDPDFDPSQAKDQPECKQQ